MTDGPDFIKAREAAALLGIKLKTLYAYASRGLVRTMGASPREMAYSRDDLMRLKLRRDARAGHGAVAAGALHWGEAVLDTAVSTFDLRGPIYRGHEATALAAEHTPFESVAELLWHGALPPVRPVWTPPPARALPTLPSGLSPMRAMLHLLPWLAPLQSDRAELAQARELIVALASVPAIQRGLAPPLEGSIASRLLHGFEVLPKLEYHRRLEAALVLSADHELNPSTFSARLAASAGADLTASLTAAMATLTGPRHGGVTDRVEALLDDASHRASIEEVIRDHLRRHEGLPGFGHRMYPQGDPRAAAMLALVEAEAPTVGRVPRVLALVGGAAAYGLEPPSLDLGLVAVAESIGLPRGGAGAIFAVGRAAGWVAHILEQRERPTILRPRARYIGVTARTPPR